MFLGSFLVFILCIYGLTWLKLVHAEPCYVASFAEDVKGCPGFKNEWLNAEGLKMGIKDGSEDEEGGMTLSGVIDLFKDLNEEIEISMSVSKETPHGNELVLTMVADLCTNLNDENTPWYPLMESLNTTLCPIVAKTYDVDEMTINLDYAKDCLTHEYVAVYECQLELKKDAVDTVSCFIVGIAISEIEC